MSETRIAQVYRIIINKNLNTKSEIICGFIYLSLVRPTIISSCSLIYIYTHTHIYQPLPLGQDMTQGQFLSGVLQV